MAVQADPYLSAYLRKPRIPDTAVVPDPGNQTKLCFRRGGPRGTEGPGRGPLEAEVQSSRSHGRRGQGSPDDPELPRGGPLVARRLHPARDSQRRWQGVDKADVRRWTVRLQGEYSTAYAGDQFRAVRRFLRWLAIEDDRPDPVKGSVRRG